MSAVSLSCSDLPFALYPPPGTQNSVLFLQELPGGAIGIVLASISSVQFSSVTHSCPTLCDHMDCSTPGFPVHHQHPELAQTHVHHFGDAIQPSHPLSFPSPPACNLSQHQGLSSESVLHIRWPKYWSFSSSISPCNEYSGLIFFRMDWFDLLAGQGTLKSLQYHSSRASILWRSAFFIAQLSHPYMTAGKTVALVSLAGDKSLFCIINQY